MPSQRKFHKTLILVTVLSERPYDPSDLEQVAHDIEFSDAHSGKWEITHHEKVDGPTMAGLLQEQKSEPEFFGLTAEGEDVGYGTEAVASPEDVEGGEE